jgi:hypothetical protein
LDFVAAFKEIDRKIKIKILWKDGGCQEGQYER